MCIYFCDMFGIFGNDYKVDDYENDKYYDIDSEIVINEEVIECFDYFFCCCCVGMFFY